MALIHDPPLAAARWILVAISLLNLVFLLGMLFGYHPPTELHGVAPSIKLLLTTTVMSALLTAAALVYIVLAWKNHYWGIALPRVLHPGHCRRPRFCLVPQPMEPVRLAILAHQCFQAGVHINNSRQLTLPASK